MKLLDFERQGLLFPLLVVAAIGVIILSAVSTAAIVGWIPAAHSDVTYGVPSPSKATRPAEPARRVREPSPPAVGRAEGAGGSASGTSQPPPASVPSADGRSADAAHCPQCGTVMSVQPVEVKGTASGVGAIAGGVVGGVIGNQVGHGTGRALATVVGAGGGAWAGHELERGSNASVRYRVLVRTDAGRARTYTVASNRWQPGDRVNVQDGRLEAVEAVH